MLNKYEKMINNAKNKKEIKDIVRIIFKDDKNVDDIDFNNLIYMNVIPKLEELGVTFDRENEIDYEKVMKEEY